jgi:protein O-mannosyl-transferase
VNRTDQARSSNSLRWKVLAATSAGLCLITAAVYAPVRHYQFVNYDDYEYVRDNPLVLGGFSPQNLVRAFTTFYSYNWHPLTWLSHTLDFRLWGLNAGGHHTTNVIFHTANVLLLCLVFTSMTGALWRSALVAAVFAWHPLHVESVAWISERKDLLSTFFWLLTMAAYVRYVRRPQVRRYLLVVMCFALALMSKPMAVTLPFVLLLLDYWPLNRATLAWNDRGEWRKLILEKTPLFTLALASSLITIQAQYRSGAVRSLLELPLEFRISNALLSYVNYLWKAVFPVKLSVFYPFPSAISLWQVTAAAVFLLGLTALAFTAAKSHPYAIVSWLWYAGTLLPVIGLVQVGDQAMADRYTYIPLIGLSIAAVWGTWEVSKRTRRAQMFAALLGAAVLLLLLYGTSRQLRYWTNNIALFQHALSVTSRNWLAHNNLSNALLEQHRDFGDAENHALEALRIRSDYPEAQVNLGVALLRQGKNSAAISHLEKAVALQPDWPEAQQHLGYAQMVANRTAEAIQTFSNALYLDPNLILALKSLAWIRATEPNPALRNGSEAIVLATRVTQLTHQKDPDTLRTLAAALAEVGRFDEAVSTGEHARGLALGANQTELARNIDEELDLYRLALPYRNKASRVPDPEILNR